MVIANNSGGKPIVVLADLLPPSPCAEQGTRSESHTGKQSSQTRRFEMSYPDLEKPTRQRKAKEKKYSVKEVRPPGDILPESNVRIRYVSH